ncbi:MAG: RnfH family protein, partial [Betaproteobacteria bacterium]|nr:RnfH family protein [Betaproteobacteria bacterium]
MSAGAGSPPDGVRASVFWQDEQGRAWLREVCLPPGATLGDAVRASGLESMLGGASWQGPDAALRLAVFGASQEPGRALRDGERVDITRAL